MMETMENQPNRQLYLLVDNANKILITLFVSHALTVLFNIIPSGGEVVSMFLLDDMQLTLKMYVWFIMNEIYIISLYYVIWQLWSIKILKYFTILQGVILVDFILSYNRPIFMLFNQEYGVIHIVLVIKAVLIIKELWKQR